MSFGASRQVRAMLLLSLAELLAMSVWFSASAVVPVLRELWHLSDSGAAWLTLSVQFGFVAGTFLSALLNLPDVLNPRRLLAISALLAALSNAAFAHFAGNLTEGALLRFCTGLFLAGVYPPGMKIMATWFQKGRGTAIGVLIGALTLGKASPYLLNALGSVHWQQNLLIASVLTAIGGMIVLLFVENGPYALPAARFDLHQIKKVFANRGVRLASFGYFGHMWELYAMWTWVPVMIRASLAAHGSRMQFAELSSYLVIGIGALSCAAAGILADRIGRTAVTIGAMAMSGACCLLAGFAFDAPALLLLIMVIWGATVIADSAQFSTCVTELADPQYIGTALTLQTCLGFLLTTISIHLIPQLVGVVGWRFAFIALAPGPVFGVLSMLRLRSLPEAAKLAHGKR